MTYYAELSGLFSRHQVDLAYYRWWMMKNRCYDPKSKAYHNYGARGIRVCERWLGEEGFLKFAKDMGVPNAGDSLDRIDNDGDYSPENCRWVNRSIQRANQRRVAQREYAGLPLGVSLDKTRNTPTRKHWLARLEVGGKRVLNKRFWTKDEAIEARLKAEKEFL